MIRPAALVIGFSLTLLAGKAANIVADAGLNRRASSVGVLQLLPPRATACDGGFSLSSGGPAAEAVGLLSITEYAHDRRPTGTLDVLRGRDGGQSVLPEPSAGHDAPSCEVGDGWERPVLGAVGEAGGHAEPGCRGHAQRQRLIDAVIQVESNGRTDCVGDNGRAVGILQIWPITVADANRILGRDEFTLADRLSPERSVAIFNTITEHYSHGASDEVKARRWNGGPTGDRKQSTEPYWRRVKAALNERTGR